MTAKKENSDVYDHGDPTSNKIVRISYSYYHEAYNSRIERMDKNQLNYDCYHLRQDYSHKREGQSREFLPKQMMATEQIATFFEQGVVDPTDWYRVEAAPGIDQQNMKIFPDEIQKLTDRQLDKASFKTVIHDTFKLGLLGCLCIVKVGGKRVPRIKYEAKNYEENGETKTKILKNESTVWQLEYTIINPEDYYPDPNPSGRKIYEMHQGYFDFHEVQAMSEGPNAIYDPAIVEQLKYDFEKEWYERIADIRRTGANFFRTDYRKRVKLQEFWGSIVEQHTGELLYKNVVWTIANDKYLIRKPSPNPYWHQECPIVVAPIIRVPNSVWHRAVMDSPTRHNIALNELYNLNLDAGLMSTYGIKQYRPDWLEDEGAYDEGFIPGDSVAVNANCPPGGKAIERVDTSSMSQESLAMYQIVNQEFNQSAMTNDLRMGNLPGRQVKATEVVEASQTLNGLFGGITQRLEAGFVTKILDLSWKNTLQHMDDLAEPEVRALLGDDRALAIGSMSKEERFANTVLDSRFKVYGMSRALQKQKDFRKLTSFLQTIGTSPLLVQEFSQKFSMPRMLEEIMDSLELNTRRLESTPQEQQAAQARMQQMAQLAMGQQGGAQNGPMEASLADQSQIPQAGTGFSNALQSKINNPNA